MKCTWKKLLSLSLAATMALSLAACGQSETSEDTPLPWRCWKRLEVFFRIF